MKMTQNIFIGLFLQLFVFFGFAQAETFLADPRTGCKIRFIRLSDPANSTATWSGACVSGFAQGYGTMALNRNETIFVGEMRNGWRNGKGRVTWSGGSYEGDFVNSVLEGSGIWEDEKGIYEGEFRNGKLNGACEAKMKANKARYVGRCVDDVFTGVVNVEYSNGVTYKGFVGNGLSPEGLGTMTTREGVLQGIFENGRLIQGTITQTDGQRIVVGPGSGTSTAGGSSGASASAGSAQSNGDSRSSRPNTNTDTCIQDIQRLQVQSQSWGLSPIETSQRLGRMQKEMFSRLPCSEHPQASGYLRGANDMLSRASESRTLVHNPSNDGSRCVQIVQAKSHPKCTGLFGERCFLNQCPWQVGIMWPGGLVDVKVGDSWPLRNQDSGRWMACKLDRKAGIGIRQLDNKEFICHD